MTETIRTTIINLRAFVVALRASFNADIKDLSVRSIRRDIKLGGRVAYSQARLAYLVPIYKAMHAAVQQAGTGAAGGVKAYTNQFEKLGKLIRDNFEHQYHHEKLFGDDVGSLQILVPVAGVPVENWQAITLNDVIGQIHQQVADERNAVRLRARTAEQARKAFLASLNDEQRALLRHALDVSRGSVISVDIRDLGV